MIHLLPLPLRLGLVALLGLSTAPAGALEIREKAEAVLELFTSQGCSRCPDADRLLSELAESDEVIALAYHIDYWDYIGWQDTFADPSYTQLQRAYAQSWGKERIYTPQLVVNGTNAVVGSDAGQAGAAIAAASAALDIEITADGEDAVTLAAAADPRLAPAVVWVVTYRDTADVVVERGENSGRVLSYTHIVTGRQAIGMWDPHKGAEITIPVAEILGSHSDGAAVIVQEKNGNLPGPILAAAIVHR